MSRSFKILVVLISLLAVPGAARAVEVAPGSAHAYVALAAVG